MLRLVEEAAPRSSKRCCLSLAMEGGGPTPAGAAAPGAASSSAAAAAAPAPAVAEQQAAPSEEAREEVFLNEDLMKLVLSHLCLDDLCKAGMVRRRWREITSDPAFWRVIDLEGKTLAVQKVCQLLRKHCGVYTLRARKIRFQGDDLPSVLPHLSSLRNLELEKPGYDERELEGLSRLPQLTRLVLAGGYVGSSNPMTMHAWGHPPLAAQELAGISSTSLRQLVLEGGRTGRLAIRTPGLTSLEVKDYMWGQLQLQGTSQLASLSILDCGKLADSALRNLLCVEGQNAQPLPALASLTISNATHLSDETLRLAGQRHPALASLHVEGCAAVTGANLAANGGFASLAHLRLEGCDVLSGSHLAASVQGMAGLQSLTIQFCGQMTGLTLHCSHLTRLRLQGNRNLQELSLRCARLASVELSPSAPGMASASVLRRISLASYAVEALHWSSFPALEEVKLQCANLEELDLSECTLLRDSVFHTLGAGDGVPGFAADGISPGCPRLRLLKLADCESLRVAALASPSLECLQLSHCQRLERVDLACPSLSRLGLEECTALESVNLDTQRMASMSLGTCPRLERISVESPSMDSLDLRGCNSLRTLALACPALRRVDATFCGALPDGAMAAVARCPALEELTLAVCNSLTARGLTALSALQHLRSLDLSYMPIEDPRPIYSACLRLTSLTISNNYLINPDHLRALLPPAGQPGGCGPLASLAALDVSYCEVPCEVLEDLVLRGGRQLEQLTISGCAGVTDDLMLRLHRPTGGGGAGSSGSSRGEVASALRVLSMVGCKALRHVYLGLMPETLALAQGRAFWRRPPRPVAAPLVELRTADGEAGQEGEACEASTSAAAAAAVDYVGVETALPALEELRIGLTGLRTVAIGLPSLARLQLFNCAELRDLCLDCPALEALSVQACKRLPLEALAAVLQGGCPALQELDGVDPAMEAQLRAAFPHLKITALHHRI